MTRTCTATHARESTWVGPDFVALAASFGVRADSVDGLGEHFAMALKGHVALKEPTMLVAKAALGPPPNVSPLVPAMNEDESPARGAPEEGAGAAGAGRAPRRLARRATERIPPRAELMEQAAEVSRAGIRTRRERIIATARPILQTSVAASLAWLIATEVVEDRRPSSPDLRRHHAKFTIGERRRRAAELAIGVSAGIAIADLLVSWIGLHVAGGRRHRPRDARRDPRRRRHPARVTGGASAVLVATLSRPRGSDFTRSLDALVGSGTALVVGSLLLPVDPVRLVREALGPVVDRLVAVLLRIADALRSSATPQRPTPH